MSPALAPALGECSTCHAVLDAPDGSLDAPERGATAQCYCGVQAQFIVFPALRRRSLASAGEALSSDSESACFFHAAKRAAAACGSCGRFVCDLCLIRWGSQVLCPSCVAATGTNTTLLTRSRTLYDSIALTVAIFAIVLWPFSLFTAPIAIVLGILALRKPGSIVRRFRFRAWVAVVLGSAALAFWIWLIVYAILKSKTS